MNKKNYFKILRDELKRRDVKNIDDIIDDYEDLIYQKMKEGMSEEDAVRELGSIEELASSYGDAKPQTGDVDFVKFALLQVLNLIIGLPILISLFATAIGLAVAAIAMIVVIVIAVFNIISSALISGTAVLIVLTIIAGAIFAFGILAILVKLLSIIIYNYTVFNINIIRKNKILYKRIRVRKMELITIAVSLVLMISFSSASVALNRDNWRSAAREVLTEMSYYSGNNREILPEEMVVEFDENIKNLDIEGIDIVIEYGDENTIVSNYELDYEIDGDTIKISEDSFFVNYEIDFNIFKEDAYIFITTTNEFDEINVDGIDIQITDVYAKEYKIQGIDLEMELSEKPSYDIEVLDIDVLDFEIYATNVNFDEIDVDSLDSKVEIEEAIIQNMIFDSLDVEVILSDSTVELLDIKDCMDGDVELYNTAVDTLKNGDFMGGDVEKDSDSKINNYED